MGFWNDARYTLRWMGKSPGFTALAVLVIGLGVGAATAIFGVVDAVLLDPLPFPDAHELVLVRSRDLTSGSEGPLSFPDFRDLRDGAESLAGFTAFAAFAEESLILRGADGADQVTGELATPPYFSILGADPLYGRGFDADESNRLVLLGHGLFQRRFASDSAILGSSITINDAPFTVAGVLPPGFRGLTGHAELWVPMAAFDALHPELREYDILENRGTRWHSAVARLGPGVSIEAAESQLSSVAEALAAVHPRANENRGIGLRGAYDEIVGDYESSILLLGGAVGLVVLLVCANAANLFLVRVLSRSSEVALRVAIGATRGRLARQIVTETFVFGLMGGVVGILCARWMLTLLVALAPVELPSYIAARFDVRVFGFALFLAVAVGLAVGLVPAFVSRLDPLKNTARSGFGHARVQSWLAFSEIALATLLLVGAGLLGKSFHRMQMFEPGFEPRNLLTMRFHLPADSASQDSLDRLHERVRAVPGVVEAAISSHLYFGSGYMSGPITVEGREPVSAADEIRTYRHFVSAGYFDAMGIPVLQGRAIEERDRTHAPGVVVVNQSFAKAMWPSESALGKRLVLGAKTDDKPWLTVAGVVSDVEPELRLEPQSRLPQLYLPIHQGGNWSRSLVIRAAAAPESVVASLRAAVFELDPGIALYSVSLMEELLARSRATSRYVSTLMSAFAALSLLLAAIGLYGVVSFGVSRSTHEIGVRLALGAERRKVLALVLGRGLAVVSLGVAAGLTTAVALTRVLDSLLYEVDPLDGGIYAAVVLSMVAVVVVASAIPAARAASVDPARVLRHE